MSEMRSNPDHLDEQMLVRSRYKQNSTFQSSNDGDDDKDCTDG